MYVWPGVAAIWGALLFGLASAFTYLRVDRGRRDLLPLARTAYSAFAVSVVAAAAILMTLILQHRFDVSYVNSYSGADLPLHFLISTFWAGQEGSFLLWCFWGSLIGLFVWRSAKEQEAPVMIVYLSTFLGLIAILCKQSPFKLLPPPAPVDGVGLNPLLQDYWMVIHPPIMFIGFASLSVPFSFAIAALWKKRWDGWIARDAAVGAADLPDARHGDPDGRLLGLQDAGLGRLLGLGPGGEHQPRSVALHRGARARHVPAALAQAAPARSTCCSRARPTRRSCTGPSSRARACSRTSRSTRSSTSASRAGSSGSSGRSSACRSCLLAWRWRSIPRTEDEESPLLSRSVFFILGIAVFCALACVILLGTSAPILTRLTSTPSQVQTSFYAKTTTPAGLLLVLLVGPRAVRRLEGRDRDGAAARAPAARSSSPRS